MDLDLEGRDEDPPGSPVQRRSHAAMDLDLEGRDEFVHIPTKQEVLWPQWISTWRVETSTHSGRTATSLLVAAMDLDLEGRDEPKDKFFPERIVTAAMDLDLEGRDEASASWPASRKPFRRNGSRPGGSRRGW